MQTSSLIASTAAPKAPTPVYFDFTPYGITPKRPVEVRRDHSGELTVLVKLTGGNVAATTYAAFKRLMDAGVSPNWVLNSDGKGRVYVRCIRPNALGGNLLMVSRLIIGPEERRLAVRYRDGNRLNLRPENLLVERRTTNAKLKEPAVMDRLAA